MSEQKLMELLEDVANGELSPDDLFTELECVIDFSPHYEGE